MKLTLGQLLKLKFPYKVSEELDLSADLNGLEDIISSSPASVDYEFSRIDNDTYLVHMEIEIDLVLEGPVSLKGYPKHFKVESSEIFSKYEYNDDSFLIEGQTLDTKEAVIMNILLNKPMKIDDEEFEDEISDEEEYVNPAFANLKDLL